MNDQERSLWIDNDEGLYRWWRSSRQSKTAFIRDNRSEITAAINRALDRPPAGKTWRDYASGSWRRGRPGTNRRDAAAFQRAASRRLDRRHRRRLGPQVRI